MTFTVREEQTVQVTFQTLTWSDSRPTQQNVYVIKFRVFINPQKRVVQNTKNNNNYFEYHDKNC